MRPPSRDESSTRPKLLVSYKRFVLSAAGIVLATGIIHVLPDAQTALSNPCLNFNSEYPWAFTLAGEPLLPVP